MINLWADNSFSYMMGRAVLALIFCWVIGRIAGGVLQKTVTLYIEQYKKDFPIDDAYSSDSEETDHVAEEIASSPTPPGATPQPNA